MQLKEGTILKGGNFTIVSVLGQGGFGITYLAVQAGLNRKVAIKEFYMREHCERNEGETAISLGTSGGRETVLKFKNKFIREAQMIATMRHPNIVSIYDVFEENNTAYYVMEYHEGGMLSSMDLPLLPERVLFYAKQLCSALSYLHGRRIMHLDIKPSNVLTDADGNAVLIDFGVSKCYDGQGKGSTSTPVGISHGYAPIEQYSRDSLDFSPATDIYALGATMYKLLTGITPPDAGSLLGKPSLLSFPSYVPDSLATVIRCCMRPVVGERPQSVAELERMLDAVVIPDVEEPELNDVSVRDEYEGDAETLVDGPQPEVKPRKQPLYTPPPPKSGSPLRWMLPIIIFVALLAGAAYFLWPESSDGAEVSGTVGGHEYVDLGLPSGLKWAACNFGASESVEAGTYCPWSLTQGGKLLTEKGWADGWRVPKRSDVQELLGKCTWKWTLHEGVYGYRITGPNGNSIFLPASGYGNVSSNGPSGIGREGYYWTSDVYSKGEDNAYALKFDKSEIATGYYYEKCKMSLRLVCD